MEILAPAGDQQSFMAAINNGADAIYLGLGDFNARSKSTFFTTDNIREYIKLAHLFGVKVYLTVNTLLRNQEIEKFMLFITKCVEAKFDAYIVQDFGVAKILKEKFDVEIHASTQMGIHNLDGAKIAKQMGFKRVVLSRETKLEDIKLIKEQTGLEIEYFVQGALCVAFSGNCYFSALEHAKSGNRGQCLQLCRLPYVAKIDDKQIASGYLLSARDLCLIENLKLLKQSGVDSLKIEGRLRRAGYVAQSVFQYRNAVDNLNKTMNYSDSVLSLKKAFSRGDFNKSAYLNAGVPDAIIYTKVQNHLGVEIGCVEKVENFKKINSGMLYKITISSSHKIKTGDGLKFLDADDNEVASVGVGNVEFATNNKYQIYSTAKIAKNNKVFLTLDSEAENNLLNKQRKLLINIKIDAKVNQPLSVEFEYNKISVKVQSTSICQQAQNAPLTTQDFISQFSKLNDTNFSISKIDVNTENVFLPKSVLNETRRLAVQKLSEEIIKNNEKHIKTTKNSINFAKNLAIKPNTDIIIVDENFNFNNKKLDLKNKIIVLNPQNYNINVVENFVNNFKNKSNKIGLYLPVIANYNDIKILDEIVEKFKNLVLIANNIYALKYCKSHFVIAGLGLNVFNYIACNYLKELGIKQVIGSKEIAYSKGQDKFELQNYVEYMPVLGRTTLMFFCHCPIKTVFKNTCNNCKFQNLSYYNLQGNEYKIKRYKISQCYFVLLSDKIYRNENTNSSNGYFELNYLTKHELENVINNNINYVMLKFY